MSITVNQIKNHLNELAKLKQQFSDLSSQSIEKFGKIIATAEIYQTKMDPLNKDIEYLQRQQKNITDCYDKLNQIKTFRKTAREVESAVQQGPVQSLTSYLEVMDRLQQAYEFFKQNTLGDEELARLQSLFALGLKKLSVEFGAVLKQTFYPIEVERLLQRVEQSFSSAGANQSTGDMVPLEDASEPLLNKLQFMIHWMKTSQSLSISGGMHGAEGARACLMRYHEFRREVVRSTLNKLRVYLKERDTPSQPSMPTTRRLRVVQDSRTKSQPTPQRARPKRPPGFIWDVNIRRQLNETESEDLNSEHHAICIVALVKFMQNERHWLDRLRLTSSLEETQVSLDVILKVASNEVLNESHNLVRLMQFAEKRVEFHMVLSLFLVLKRISQVGMELLEVLQGIDHILFGFNSSVHKLLHESAVALQKYTEFLRQLPDHASANRAVVPPDGTVHELATNALMFFENLLEFADVLAVALHLDRTNSQNIADTIRLLCTHVQHQDQLYGRVGFFLLDAISALIENLDKKSESYSEELVQVIFLMNNVQYIIKTMHRTDIHNYISSYKKEGVVSVHKILEELRGRYSRTCACMLQIPDERQLGVTKNLDSKERATLKSMWQEFNSGFNLMVRQHSAVSIPDRDLREMLERQLVADLVPAYQQFWNRSNGVSFTSHREKYMKMSVEEFQNRLKVLFSPSSR